MYALQQVKPRNYLTSDSSQNSNGKTLLVEGGEPTLTQAV